MHLAHKVSVCVDYFNASEIIRCEARRRPKPTTRSNARIIILRIITFRFFCFFCFRYSRYYLDIAIKIISISLF